MTKLSATILEQIFKSDKIIRILLLKVVNSSMENINKILENNNWNLTRSLVMDTANFPWTLPTTPIQMLDIQYFQSSLLIIIPFISKTSRVVISYCRHVYFYFYFCEQP